MPPKGWRKNAEGQYPLQMKDADLTSIDDILFPRATVQKLAKSMLADDGTESQMIMAKDSVIALQRSATVFVSHLLYHALQISKDASRKTVNAQDILGAIERAEFPGFVPEVKHKLAAYEQTKADAKTVVVREPAAGEEAEEPLAKRAKDNNQAAVAIAAEVADEDEGEETDGETEEPHENEVDEAEEPQDEPDVTVTNPILLLEREERELAQDPDESGNEDEEG